MENRHPEYQYLDLLKQILEKGDRKVDRGTGDASFSLFGAQMRFDLSMGFPMLTTKKVFWKGVVEELYWFISGQSNVSYLTRKGVHIWDDYPYKIYNKKNPGLTKEEFVQKMIDDDAFAKEHGELPRIYGEMWRRWPTRTPGRTIDQLAWAIQELKDDPNAHNLIVNSWNPEYLYSMAAYEDASRFPICHNMYQIDLIKGKLNLQLYQRSADMFLGVPFNIASYALLTIILSRVTGYEPGEFVHTLGDFHIYEKHLEPVKEQLKREPKPFPKIELDPSVKNIDDFKPELVKLVDYDPHPGLKAELSVSGGFFEKQ
ncbi:MAG: thymidylate synthase [Candidatus Doudnabacteria bacterium]